MGVIVFLQVGTHVAFEVQISFFFLFFFIFIFRRLIIVIVIGLFFDVGILFEIDMGVFEFDVLCFDHVFDHAEPVVVEQVHAALQLVIAHVEVVCIPCVPLQGVESTHLRTLGLGEVVLESGASFDLAVLLADAVVPGEGFRAALAVVPEFTCVVLLHQEPLGVEQKAGVLQSNEVEVAERVLCLIGVRVAREFPLVQSLQIGEVQVHRRIGHVHAGCTVDLQWIRV